MTNINDIVAEWQCHRKVLLQVLETVTTEQMSYKPWEKAMTVSGLALHIAETMDMFANTVKNGEFTHGTPAQACAGAEELRASVAAQTERTEATLRSFTEEQLDRKIGIFGRQVSGAALLQEAIDHEIHHKGQLYVYLRLLGIEELPFFVSRG